MSMVDAKIGGITPTELTRSGRCVRWPPYIFRPMMRREYSMGMRRWPRSKNTIVMTDAITSTVAMSSDVGWICPSAVNCQVCARFDGKSATMPAKMISEMPLPMPRSVICSPSHMMKAVPVARVSIA
jgi:hypothetical protein